MVRRDILKGTLMFEPTIKLNKDLWNRVKKVADAAGYSSPEEFVEHIVERELAKLEDAASNEELLKKLQGLGYM
jgi:metal-responsive CopG/Arc/MetJ family transcriptional regulator